jgi:hypothetical protein
VIPHLVEQLFHVADPPDFAAVFFSTNFNSRAIFLTELMRRPIATAISLALVPFRASFESNRFSASDQAFGLVDRFINHCPFLTTVRTLP